MARGIFILVVMWAFALGGFLLLKDIPKSSAFYGLRDFFWMFLMACTIVVILGFIALVTGIVKVGELPFQP